MAAFKKGVEKIHKMGRRIQLYVSADIVQVSHAKVSTTAHRL